jgi:AraC-like DNA-binding protein
MDSGAIHNLLMPSVYVQHLTREFADASPLLRGTQLRESALSLAGGRISVRDNIRCVANALALARDPSWYQEWGTRIAGHFHGPLTLAWLSAPTLGDGLEVFVRHFPQRIPYMEFHSRLQGDYLVLELRPLIEVGALLPLLTEVPLLILQEYIGTIRNSRMSEALVELAYPAPAYRKAYARRFDCPVRFDSARSALLIPAQWLAVPNLGHEEPAWRSALQKCEEAGDREAPRFIVNCLRSELYQAFDRGDYAAGLPTLEGMAAQLHMSPRTLIRRLRSLGTTFHGERDELRKLRARELVEAGELGVSEIAERLRFSDPPNFGKAFKRWFGESPSQFRAHRKPS